MRPPSPCRRALPRSLVFMLLVLVSAAAPATVSDDEVEPVASGGAHGGALSEGYLLEVGRPFPLILLPAASDGQPLTLADFRGRKTILHVFASW